MSGDADGPPPDDLQIHELTGGSAPLSGGPGRPRARNALRLGTTLLALALIAGALIARERIPGSAPLPTPAPTVTPGAPFLPLAGLLCIRDAAWAPTSDLIGFVGSPDSTCGYGSYAANVVNIYRAQTATLLRQLHPDAAIFAALGLSEPSPTPTPAPSGGSAGYVLIYSTLRWSPDGKRLALSFAVFSPTGYPGIQYFTGLALLDADGGHEGVLVDRRTDSQQTYTVWDTQTGSIEAASAATIPADAPYSTLAPARSYSWGAGGTLTLGAPLAAGTPTASQMDGLVGNPGAGSAFGPWQPAWVSVLETSTSAQQPPASFYLFATTFAAWSPDGRYFADGVSVRGLLSAAGQPLPSSAVLSALPFQLENVAELPIRDAALAQALAHDLPQPVGASGQTTFASVVPIAWRPDGKVLAVLNVHNGYILRGADTGQIITSVAVMQAPPGLSLPPGEAGSWDWPIWSPDGKWLLLPTGALINTSRLGV